MLLAVHVNGVVLDRVGDAEVDEFETALEKEEVGRFEIRVHDVVRVHGRHAFQHFFPEVSRKGDVEEGVFRVEPEREHPVQIRFSHFHQNAERLFGLVELPVEQSDDAVDVLEFLEQVDLAFEAADGELVLVFEGDPLQREDLVVLRHDPIHFRAPPRPIQSIRVNIFWLTDM